MLFDLDDLRTIRTRDEFAIFDFFLLLFVSVVPLESSHHFVDRIMLVIIAGSIGFRFHITSIVFCFRRE